MIKYLVLDTNIIRRLLEKNNEVEAKLNLLKQEYEFVLSDLSFFEITNFIVTLPFDERVITWNNLRIIIIKYEFRILSKINFNSNEIFIKFLKNKMSIEQVKNNLLKSFAWNLSKFITNLYVITVINLANSLEANYNSAFYNHIQKITNPKNKNNIYTLYEKRLNNIILECYRANQIKFNNHVKLEFKEIVIDILTSYELSKTKTSWSRNEFEEKNSVLRVRYLKSSFKEILKLFVNEEKIYIKKVPEMDELDFCFISKYIARLNTQNPTFNINDITDYHNFINAFKHNAPYLTLDGKSLKLYKEIFADHITILGFIDKCKEIKLLQKRSDN